MEWRSKAEKAKKPFQRFHKKHTGGPQARPTFLPMLRFLLLFLSVAVLFGCATSRRSERVFSKKLVRQIEASPVFAQSFTGFALADAETGKLLAATNADKYFTPASNTKILTLHTCLRVLGDSLPGLEYVRFWAHNHPGHTMRLSFRGTGDPTFLHPKFHAWQPVFDFLKKNHTQWELVDRPFADKRFGPGWAWDDYSYYYQPEKSAFPIYGNCVWATNRGGQIEATPAVLGSKISITLENKSVPKRAEFANDWTFAEPPSEDEAVALPIFQPNIVELLKDTLQRPVEAISPESFAAEFNEPIDSHSWYRTVYSCPTDTVLRRMMYQSDNFIAEQLLLVCAGLKHKELAQKKIIQWAQDSLLTGLRQPPKWVDGSGLSRYNLNTPYNNVEILRRLWHEQPRERLLSLFPAGGTADTTLAEWFAPKPGGRPYIFAKSGSMSGVYCLSGYVVGRSGRVLAFSFMHNNFVGSNRAWKAETQRFLEQIRDRN